MSFAMEGLRTLVREKRARLSRFAVPFMHKNAIFLPRQARDEHIEGQAKLKKTSARFSQVVAEKELTEEEYSTWQAMRKAAGTTKTRAFLRCHFFDLHKNDHFAKTGSGQT